MTYYAGAAAHLTAAFTDLSGNPADPTTVTVSVVDPSGATSVYGGAKDSTGNYHYDLALSLPGVYTYVWQGAGALVAAQFGSLVVVPLEPLSGWTYSGNPLSSAKDEVRALAADTDSSRSWTLSDAEINYAITVHSGNPPQIGNNFLAAAVCVEMILGRLKTVPQSKTVGDLKIDYGEQFKFYKDRAYGLRQSSTLKNVKLYAGGISLADKIAYANDPDKVQPAGVVDGMNYASPLGSDPEESGH